MVLNTYTCRMMTLVKACECRVDALGSNYDFLGSIVETCDIRYGYISVEFEKFYKPYKKDELKVRLV